MPLVSIITVARNDRAGLARTLGSVARQTLGDRESIVIDGASTDGSQEVVREHAARGTVADWVSEPDAGIFEAMNKGVRRAKGTYLVFMNAGDEFSSDDALQRFFAAGAPVEDLLYSDAIVEHEDGKDTHVWALPERLDWDFLMRDTLAHQSCAFRRELFDRVGLHDERFRMAGDYEFTLRAVVARGCSWRKVPVPLSRMVWGGFSNRPENYPLQRAENQLARERALGPMLVEHFDRYLALRRGFLHHRLRTLFRPLARKVRGFFRRLRGHPNPDL